MLQAVVLSVAILTIHQHVFLNLMRFDVLFALDSLLYVSVGHCLQKRLPKIKITKQSGLSFRNGSRNASLRKFLPQVHI